MTKANQESVSSCYERVKNAAVTLATTTGRLQERLGDALVTLAPLNAADFPSDLRASFTAILHAFAGAGSGVETAHRLTDEQAEDVAEADRRTRCGSRATRRAGKTLGSTWRLIPSLRRR